MIFGIPHELKDHETRVGCGLVPRNVATLVSQGHTVYFQKGVMEPAGVPDEEFLKAGAKRVDTMEEVYEKSDFIAKFKDMTDGRHEDALQEGPDHHDRLPHGRGHRQARSRSRPWPKPA